MRSAWYLLLYHNVSWEENPYLRGLDVTLPPDLLREHIAALGRLGDLVSVAEGLRRLGGGGGGGPPRRRGLLARGWATWFPWRRVCGA
jgi:hypothetical protein